MAEFQMRKVLLTIQNPRDKGFSHSVIRDILASMNVSYFCMGDEIGTAAKTYHTHVFIYRKTAIRERTIRKKFPNVHFDACLGTCKENRDYILKQGKWANTEKAETTIEGTFEEWGDMPIEKSESNIENNDLINLIQSGFSTAEIIKINDKYKFKTNDINTLRETLHTEKYSNEDRDVDVIYIYGPSGTGKTRSIFNKHEYKDICRITNYGSQFNSIKFDAYHGQSVLVFEEFHGQVAIEDMLNYLDRYPVMLPARYTDRVACYRTVYITSNISLYDQYTIIQLNKPEVWKAFLRRIHRIVEFDSTGTPTELINLEYKGGLLNE